jgi:hypothetical protein
MELKLCTHFCMTIGLSESAECSGLAGRNREMQHIKVHVECLLYSVYCTLSVLQLEYIFGFRLEEFSIDRLWNNGNIGPCCICQFNEELYLELSFVLLM